MILDPIVIPIRFGNVVTAWGTVVSLVFDKNRSVRAMRFRKADLEINMIGLSERSMSRR